MGARGGGRVEQESLVRRPAFFCLARDARLQDARARTAVALSRLHALHGLRRRTPENGGAAVAPRQPRACRQRARRDTALSAARRRVECAHPGGTTRTLAP